jgi:hypothetical protein
VKRYPQLGDPNSELGKKYLEVRKRLSDENNSIMEYSDSPERVADMAAAELNQQFEAASISSRQRAAQKYPVLGDPNSELTKKYLEIVKRLADENSPISKDSNAAELIADMAAAELNVAANPDQITPKQ